MLDLILRMIILLVFSKIVFYYPGLKKYKSSTKFNFYRSLMCIYFSFNSLDILVNNFKNGISSPVLYQNKSFDNISNWFIAYLIYDLFFIFTSKKKRIDLIIHHIFCLFVYIYQKNMNHCNFIMVLFLITESMSIVSGADNIAKENKNIKLSCKFKKLRISIIRNLRIPVWILSFLMIIRFNKHFNNTFEFYLSIIGPLVMIYLDNYWENLCVKFLKKNNKLI